MNTVIQADHGSNEDAAKQSSPPLDSLGEDVANHHVAEQNAANEGMASQDEGTPAMTHQALDEYLTNGYNYERPRHGDIRNGVIVAADDQRLVVDIGTKREGFVYQEDLSRLDEETRAEIKVGDELPVFVIRPADREGHPILSIHQARLCEDWLEAEEMAKSGKLYEGEIAGFNRGGLIVRFGKIRGFIPASQVVGLPRRLSPEERRRRLEEKIGDRVGLKVIEVDRRRRRLIFSQRRALRAWQEVQRERVMSELVVGETRHGTVSDITSFGAFVDLGGADGLVHVSEMSWRRVDDPHNVLKKGQEVDVYVLDVDRQRKRIALSLKKLLPDPWTLVDDEYQIGDLIEGRVTRVLDFGAFIELDLGLEGLLHASEMIGTPELRPTDIVYPGETLLVKVIRIDSQRRRLALSAKQVRKSEWERWVAEQQALHEAEEASKKAEEEALVSEAEPEAAPSEDVETQAAAAEVEAVAPTGEAVDEEAGVSEPEPSVEVSTQAAAAEVEAVAPTGEAVDEEAGVSEPEPSVEVSTQAAAAKVEAVAPTGEAVEEERVTSEPESNVEVSEASEREVGEEAVKATETPLEEPPAPAATAA